VNVVVNSSFASLISDGAISWLSYAFRLMQLPIGVFGVAVGTTSLTLLSQHAAKGDWQAVRVTLRRGLRTVLFLTIPSTIGLALLGVPIIRLIFQHGRFSADATLQTARALSGYALGLVFYASTKVAAQAFYAVRQARVPVIASVAAVAGNLAWNALTFRTLGHVGLAVGTSLAATVNIVVLLAAFQLRIGGLFSRDLFTTLARILIASGVMAAAVWALRQQLERWPAAGLAAWSIKALVPVVVGAAVYFGAARLLRLEEARTFTRRFRR